MADHQLTTKEMFVQLLIEGNRTLDLLVKLKMSGMLEAGSNILPAIEKWEKLQEEVIRIAIRYTTSMNLES